MPIYEYHCPHCGQSSEILQKVSDPPETVCPHCQQSGLEKMVSAAGFQLKGSGWYVTDFKDKNKKLAEKPATEAKETKETKTSETKTDK